MSTNTIAVLPFVNVSENPDNEYFSDGITFEIINALAKLDRLKVISHTSSFRFKNQTLSIPEIAEQLDVNVVLEGSVRRAGDRVRISAQLIETETDFHFWSETWDRKVESIFDTQNEISLLIADKLREQFGHFDIQDRLVESQTDQIEAYEYAMKARFLFNKWNPASVQSAMDLYKKAIALDPNLADAYVGLSDAYGFLATVQAMPRDEGWKLTAAYTRKALALDPANAGAQYQLANLAFYREFNFGKAAHHAKKAITLQPNHSEAQQLVVFLSCLANTFDRAEKELERAVEIDPVSKETRFYKAFFHYRKGDYAQALELTEFCLTHNPLNLPAYALKASVLLMLGKYDEAEAWISRMPIEIRIPDEITGISCLASFLRGDVAKGEALLAQIKAEAQKLAAFQAHNYVFLALGVQAKYDEAFAWADQMIAMKSAFLFLGFSDPLVGALKKDARYKKYHDKLYAMPSSRAAKKPSAASLLDAETADSYSRRLLTFMDEAVPWLNPALSLRSLAGQVDIHPNQLSWVLNNRLGKNFNEFINHYRVKTFKELALDPANANISLLGLAYESGFNSKTVFNTYFKKETGMTPKAYIKAHSDS